MYAGPFDPAQHATSVAKSNQSIYVLGAGKTSSIILPLLDSAKIPFTLVDNDKRKVGKLYCGHIIASFSEVYRDTNPLLILAINDIDAVVKQIGDSKQITFYSSEKLLLLANKIANEFDIESVKRQYHAHLAAVDLSFNKENLIYNIKSLDLVVTEKCTLKCADCSNLMQYYKSPVNASIHQLITHIKRLSTLPNRIEEFRIIGGEPLIVQGLDELVKETNNLYPDSRIVIYTNGTIVPKKEVLESFSNHSVRLEISNYNESSRNIDKLVERCMEQNVRFYVQNHEFWYDCGRVEDRGRSPIENSDVYLNCCVKESYTILHDFIYRCPFSANLHNLGFQTAEAHDSFNLSYNLNNKSLSKWLFKQGSIESLTACTYCGGRDYRTNTVPIASQTKKVLSLPNQT